MALGSCRNTWAYNSVCGYPLEPLGFGGIVFFLWLFLKRLLGFLGLLLPILTVSRRLSGIIDTELTCAVVCGRL